MKVHHVYRIIYIHIYIYIYIYKQKLYIYVCIGIPPKHHDEWCHVHLYVWCYGCLDPRQSSFPGTLHCYRALQRQAAGNSRGIGTYAQDFFVSHSCDREGAGWGGGVLAFEMVFVGVLSRSDTFSMSYR